jgi:hypothetical protein
MTTAQNIATKFNVIESAIVRIERKIMKTRPTITISCTPENKEKLEAIALNFDCKWGEKPNISALIESIATGDIELSSPSRQALAKSRIASLKEEIKRLENIN